MDGYRSANGIYDGSSVPNFYQSKAPLFDTTKLSFVRKLTINNVEISAYADNDHVYDEPRLSEDKSKELSQILYLWKQGNVHYSAVFNGIDNDLGEHLETLVMAPLR